jgi:hypothetical protein
MHLSNAGSGEVADRRVDETIRLKTEASKLVLRQLRVLARRSRRDGPLVNVRQIAGSGLRCKNCENLRRGIAAG